MPSPPSPKPSAHAATVDERLRELLESVSGGVVTVHEPEQRKVSLWSLGLSSSALVALLHEIQSELGACLPDDLPAGALSSYDSLLGCVLDALAERGEVAAR